MSALHRRPPPEFSGPSLVRLAAGACVYSPAEPMCRLFRIDSGRVRLLERTGGRQRVAGLLGPGDLFGDFALPVSDQHRESAVCDTPVALLAYDAPDGSRGWDDALFTALIGERRGRERHLRMLCFENVETRLVALIVDLSHRLGTPCHDHPGGIELSGVTQEDLADLVGSSRAFVSTTLNRLKRAGVLLADGRTICWRGTQRRSRPGRDGV